MSSPDDLYLQAQPQSSPDQSILSSVQKGLKSLRLATQKQIPCAAIPVLTLFLGFSSLSIMPDSGNQALLCARSPVTMTLNCILCVTPRLVTSSTEPRVLLYSYSTRSSCCRIYPGTSGDHRSQECISMFPCVQLSLRHGADTLNIYTMRSLPTCLDDCELSAPMPLPPHTGPP